jgi:L-alanine-DL-glutamate epimerase-like enolase superfamily enzyme
LQAALPAGAARCALDCALWDLRAKALGVPAWQLAGLPRPGQLVTAYTLSLDTPEKMGEAARAVSAKPLLKLKLGGEGDIATYGDDGTGKRCGECNCGGGGGPDDDADGRGGDGRGIGISDASGE